MIILMLFTLKGALTLSTNQRALLTLVQLCLTMFTQTYLNTFQVGEY